MATTNGATNYQTNHQANHETNYQTNHETNHETNCKKYRYVTIAGIPSRVYITTVFFVIW